MIAKASLKYIRITPRKFRLIIPLIKGRSPEEAIAVLASVKKGASKYAIELLKSAIANARRAQQGIDVSTLCISKLIADCGPTLKRFRAASMGRASPILKRTSHITIELDVAKKPIEEPAKVRGNEHAAGETARVHGPKPFTHDAKVIPGKAMKTETHKKIKSREPHKHKTEPGKKGKE